MKKFFCVSLVAALSLLFFSCSNFFSSSSSDNEGVPNGKARVHFSVGKTDARTIMPEIYTEEDISLVELTAQKISEGEAIVYKLDGENEKLSRTSLADLENVSIDIDYGTYTFVLNLSIEDEEENKTVLVQTCTLENQEINAGTKELVFNMQEDSGDVSIAVSWELRDEPNRIGKIKAGLYTIASNGETTIGISDAEKTLTIKGADTSVTATGSYASVPSGSYLIKLFLYDNADATSPFNTITDIIKVNGYKTLYDLKLDPNELNVQYEAVFDPNGGTWGDDTTGAKTVHRNAYSGFIPPEEEVTNDELGLVGWYTFPDDRIPENPEELGISGGTSYEKIARENYAQDYKFFAIWGKKTGGKLITDNRALIIKTDIVDGKIYQNSKINLSVTDSNGNEVDDADVNYTAQILYKGKDINGLTVEEHPYYHADGKEIVLHGLENPLPKEKYQLYVTASRDMTETEQVTSSQTFDVELTDGFATPETQVALYNYDSDSGSYNYYLTNSDYVGAELGTANLTSNRNIIAFDAQGNFYTANFDSSGSNPTVTVYSDVLDAAGIELTIKEGTTNFTGGFKSFVIDLATNTAYAWTVSSPSGKYTWYLFKYPNLISEGKADNPVFWASVQENEGSFVPEKIAVNNNILYVLGTESGKDKMYVYDVSSDSATKLTSSGVDIDDYVKNHMTLGSGSVSDMYAIEGAVYLLVSRNGCKYPAEVYNNNPGDPKNIYMLGAVIKYVLPEPGATDPLSTMKYIGLKESQLYENTDIPYMYLFTTDDYGKPIYKDEGESELMQIEGMHAVSNSTSGTLCNAFFPNVYAITNAREKNLSAPAKVIAIKPKKLIIADDGIAFYTDNDHGLAYKNMNRVVTIDLEKFVTDSIQDQDIQSTKATFGSEVTGYLRASVSLADVTNFGTYYDSTDGYYRASDNQMHSYSVSGNTGRVMLAIRNGDSDE